MKRKTLSENYDYLKLKNLIRELCEEYPFIKTGVIGRSCAGRDITALRIGNASEYTLFAASFHGSEHITGNVLMLFLEELAHSLKNNSSLAGINVQKALSGRGIIFVPRVNPDGCEISIKGAVACGTLEKQIKRLCNGDFEHWNANLRGVDINHNFNAGWEKLKKEEIKNGIYGPSPTRYGGHRPESEPETLALCELCRNTKINHAVALHSQGEVIYWNYKDNHPPRAKRMAEIMATSSGYALDSPTGLALGGGFKDWFIEEFNRPGFTVEIGKGENPLPINNAFNLYEELREMFMLSSIM